jgi:hypothetical protein
MTYRIATATNIHNRRTIALVDSLADAEARICALFPTCTIIAFDIDAEHDAADACLSNGTLLTVEPVVEDVLAGRQQVRWDKVESRLDRKKGRAAARPSAKGAPLLAYDDNQSKLF